MLEGLDIFVVSVHCEVEELDRREGLRGDRRVGEGREHLEVNRLHELVEGRNEKSGRVHDFEINTTKRVTAMKVKQLVDVWERRQWHRAWATNRERHPGSE
jgi:chloramphenicol 3-O phosphotransferase